MTIALPAQIELCLAEPLLQLQADEEECGVHHGKNERNNDDKPLFDASKLVCPHFSFSVSFSLVQIFIFVYIILKDGIAPLVVNPLIGPAPDVLDYWGAKNSALILNEGEYLRTFTAMYLHNCLPQLLCDVFVQLTIMRMLEKHWGNGVTCIIFVSSGMIGYMLSACLSPASLSVGSSGGIMGVLGAKMVEVLLQLCNGKERIREGDMAIAWASVTLGLTEIVTSISHFPQEADWTVPVGGMVTGMMFGLALYLSTSLSKTYSLWTRVALMGLIVLSVALGFGLNSLSHNVSFPEDLYDICAYCKSTYDNYKCIEE